jgi:ribonuclease HII
MDKIEKIIVSEEQIKEKIAQNEKVIFLDECAAGVLCFDLFVCGVVISQQALEKLKDVNDSKKLSEKKRAELFPRIVELATDYEIVRITP